MSWATLAIEKLRQGQSVTVKPHGNSMVGLISSGDSVLIEPLTHDPDIGDVVLVRCKGADYLHLIKARRDQQFLIGNNHGHLNGWVHRRAIYGKAAL